jgi:hypothetical protein
MRSQVLWILGGYIPVTVLHRSPPSLSPKVALPALAHQRDPCPLASCAVTAMPGTTGSLRNRATATYTLRSPDVAGR